MIAKNPIRNAIDWGELAPLRLRARQIAQGVYAGVHRSALRGSGVEFGGFREYVAGDDLRWLDRRSLLRHDRLIVRQFETETDRTLSLLVDASASMGYRGSGAPASKIAFASLLAAALSRVALAGGEPVGLSFVAEGRRRRPSRARAVAISSSASSWRSSKSRRAAPRTPTPPWSRGPCTRSCARRAAGASSSC